MIKNMFRRKSSQKFTCIIPFYNEGQRTVSVVKEISKIKSIDQILCIDDGSTDQGADLIKETFSGVRVLVLPHNKGKAIAVREGLKFAINNNIFLVDADLENINPKEFEEGLEKFFRNKIDMLIFRVFTTQAGIDGLLGKYTTFSGTRIFKKKDLQQILKGSLTGYQLESAINNYFLENQKIVKFTKCSAVNPNKIKKAGFIKGFFQNIQMDLSIISHLGLLNHLKQLFSFRPDEI